MIPRREKAHGRCRGLPRHRPRVSLELHLEPEPDVAGLVVEAIRTEERIVERVQRPLLLGEGVLPVAVAEPRFDPPQRFAVERLAPVPAVVVGLADQPLVGETCAM